MASVLSYSSSGNTYINALLGEAKWATNRLTYSFPTKAAVYGGSYGSGETTDMFGAFNAVQQAVSRSALKLYSSVANLSFSEFTGTSAGRADIRFAMSDLPSTAWAYFPSTNSSGGDVWMNNTSGIYDAPRKGNYAYLTTVHEIGHALGLEHAHEGNVMPLSRDSMEYTVMSYRSYVGASTTSGYVNETWGYAQSLMMYDIAALQHMYGANYSTNSGNTAYSWSPTTGEMFINGARQGAPGGNQIFQTLWDGGGVDTYSFTKYTTALAIDLNPGAWTRTTTEQRAKLSWDGSKLAAGNIANALLYNNNARSLIENAYGGAGSDTIKGNVANNRLLGNAGNDKLYGLNGNDILIGGAGRDALVGGNGLDFVLYTTAKTGILADLAAPRFNKGDAAGDTYSSIERLGGSGYADSLRGNDASNVIRGYGGNDLLYGRDGNDVLYGDAGNDRLFAQGGCDTLVGGAGSDLFIFTSPTMSRGSGIDRIADFVRGADHIYLRGIDANTKVSGDQAFSFIGKYGFTGKPGQLNFANGLLSGDLNGDRIADFQVKIAGLSALAKGDFYL